MSESNLLLQKLHPSEDAAYERGQQGHHGGKRTPRLPGTRAEVMHRLVEWLHNARDRDIFWLNGMAGTGKSTIADSLHRYARAMKVLGAGCFCSRDLENARDVFRIFPTIAYQLAINLPSQYRTFLL